MDRDLDDLLAGIVGRLGELQERVDALERLERTTILARYTTDAGQAINDATVTVVDFEDVDVDTHGAVTTGASWVFTAPVGGYYLVLATIRFVASTAWAEAEYALLRVRLNGTLHTLGHQVTGLDSSAGSAAKSASLATVVKADAGDEIDVPLYQDSGSQRALDTTPEHNWVVITKL